MWAEEEQQDETLRIVKTWLISWRVWWHGAEMSLWKAAILWGPLIVFAIGAVVVILKVVRG